eukprot:scaffold3050_cov362-Prasinococcus_capsulatus_cf.AAC.5
MRRSRGDKPRTDPEVERPGGRLRVDPRAVRVEASRKGACGQPRAAPALGRIAARRRRYQDALGLSLAH